MRILILLFAVLLQQSLMAQQTRVGYLVQKCPREKVDEYGFLAEMPYLTVESKFSSDSIASLNLDSLTLLRIDYVYSHYRSSKNFDQQALDRFRLQKLAQSNPSLLSNTMIEWRIYEQTGCNDPQSCDDFFHGFVLYYRPIMTKEARLEEIKTLSLSLDRIDSLVYKSAKKVVVKYPRSCRHPELRKDPAYLSQKYKEAFKKEGKIKGKYTVRYELDAKGKVLQAHIEGFEHPAKEKITRFLKKYMAFSPGSFGRKKYPGTLVGTLSFPINRKSFVFKSFTFPEYIQSHFNFETATYGACKACRIDTAYEINSSYRSTDVSQVLDRNKSWSRELILTDVTGSMSPYITDLMIWLRLNTLSDPKQFVFFNDGDTKADKDKTVGKTGGVYSIRTGKYEEVKTTLLKAMSGGGGGDCPENNFEALLQGRKDCPDCVDAIMIADNYAFPRDEALLKNYKGKLKIILCGTDRGINEQYLNLARKYHFSIHTLKSDLTTLFELNEGAEVEIDNYTYKIKKGNFVRLYGT